MQNTKSHWEQVFHTKQPHEVSWTEEVPETSLTFFHELYLPKTANIIDIGGGDSRLVDFLLKEGYINITVLDISAQALERARQRLGEKAQQVRWIVSDILDFQPDTAYDLWHDRAAFHFLTTPEDKYMYREIAAKAVAQFMVIGTFSDTGPKKCSGLDITQYNEAQLSAQFEPDFEPLHCIRKEHQTPFGTVQNFVFCLFRRAGEADRRQ